MKNFGRSSILLIGAGRLAQHLRYWNSLLPNPNHLICWDRSQDLNLLTEYKKKASLVWLAIADSALVSFYEENLTKFDGPVLHFSGAVYDQRMLSAHPLMSFPLELLPSTVYPQIHFALTGATTLQEVMPGFTNTFSAIPAQDKNLYHALCVMSGNFPQLLWAETFPQLAKLNIPESAVELYIQQITENFINLKNRAITGPIARKDYSTIEKNSVALQNSKLQKVYQSFAQEFTK